MRDSTTYCNVLVYSISEYICVVSRYDGEKIPKEKKQVKIKEFRWEGRRGFANRFYGKH